LGISYNDYVLWGENRNYGDPDIYTLDLMKKVCNLKKDENIYEKYVENLIPFFKTYPVSFFQSTGFIILLCMAVILALSNKKYKYFLITGSLLIPLLLEFYLFCNDRYGRTHVDIVIFYSVSLILLSFLVSANVEKKTIISVFLVGMGMFILTKDYGYITTDNYYGNNSFRVEQNIARTAIDTISEKKQNLYVISYSEFTGMLRAYDTFEQVETGSLDNLFLLSAFVYPSHNAVLDKYHINNIYEHMCDYYVYYVTSSGKKDVNTILRYLREHYYPDASYCLVESFDNVCIYKFFNNIYSF